MKAKDEILCQLYQSRVWFPSGDRDFLTPGRAHTRAGQPTIPARGTAMNVFELRDRLVDDYSRYTHSFIKIADPRIWNTVESALNGGAFWPGKLYQTGLDPLPTDPRVAYEARK